MLVSGLVLGAVLGFVMQRGRFCVTGFLRDLFTQRSTRGLIALLIVISVHAVGLAALTTAGVITPEYDEFAPVAVIIGGFIFGLGIVLAGGCASGTWYRSGEGLVGSWIALFMYGLSAAAMKYGVLEGAASALKSQTVPLTTLPATFGTSAWPFAVALTALTAWLAVRQLRREFSGPKPAVLKAKKTGLAHLLSEKPWHVYATAAIVGTLGVIAWPLSAATGRNDGLGITTPSANLTSVIVTGNPERFDWGVLLVVGILVGSFIAAKASGEFRVRVPDATQSGRSVVGGIFMGVGAALAGGCTVGNGMVQTSLFSYQGWAALAAITVGVGVAAKLWLKPASAQADGGSVAQKSVAPRSPRAPHTAESITAVPATDVEAPAPVSFAGTSSTPSFATAPVGLLERPVVAKPAGLQELGNGRWGMDSLGAVCPFPLIEAKDAIKRIDVGDELVITFDCTQATDAIPRWAAQDGHEITEFEQTDDAGWIITVKRGQ
ncbi:YeeE/YedE thiosulfate transporter family protein [Corynebacterium sp. H78]|uniref:YeeE/YedE thiosulfate transporter family protein n=1 Tax=Corynebacterium sp. H78 TaxID=3133417 RepID=UPI0030A90797